MKPGNLKELAQVVNRNKVKQIQVIGEGKSRTKISQLYYKLQQEDVSEEEAILAVFPQDNYAKGTVEKTRYQLYERLLNTLFFIDLNQPNYTERQKAYFKCQKDLAALSILFNNNAHSNAVQLCKRIIKHSQVHGFVDLAAKATRLLCHHYVIRDFNAKLYEKYERLNREYNKYLEAETAAEDMYFNITVLYNKSKVNYQEISRQAAYFAQTLDRTYANIPTANYNYFYYYVRMTAAMCSFDYELGAHTCTEAIKALSQFGAQSQTTRRIFLLNLLVCTIQIKDQPRGREAFEQLMATGPKPGSSAWFMTMEFGVKLMLHTKNYEQGFLYFKEGMSNKMLGKLPTQIQERWRLLHLYFYVLSFAGWLKDYTDDRLLNNITLGRMLNQLRKIEKQKTKYNISVLVVRFIIFLTRGQFDKYIDSLDSINQYGHRYFKEGLSKRTILFIRILTLIPDSGFALPRLLPRVEKILKQLREEPLELQPHEIEILPYEDSWEIIAEILRK